MRYFAYIISVTVVAFCAGCQKPIESRMIGHWKPIDQGFPAGFADYYGPLDSSGTGNLTRVDDKGKVKHHRIKIVSKDQDARTICYLFDMGGGFSTDVTFCVTFSEDYKTLIRNNDYSLVWVDSKDRP